MTVLNRNKLKNEWFGSRMSDETKLEHLFDLIEQDLEATPARTVLEEDTAVVHFAFGLDEQEFMFKQQSDKTWSIDLDMTEPEQLGDILRMSPAVSAAYVSTPHWPVYRFIARDLFDLLSILRAWSVL
jgi:hypothetical protein